MRYGSVKHIVLYYKAIPGMLRLMRQERAELEGNYYGLRGLACDGMPRGSSPGKPTEESGLRALENGVSERLAEIAEAERVLSGDEACIRACLDALNGRYKEVIVMRYVRGYSWAKISARRGALMIDGLTDGIWLMNNGDIPAQTVDETAFGILQAARLRTSKTEYISCPGCGRTLYDLRETIAKIKEATKHLKGLKIGIMGCIVNGPGEMADADYGYVGAGPNRVSLYRKQVCVEKNIPQEVAVEHLLALIDSDKQ